MALTKNGVCYNLEISPYKYTVDKYTFVFSSQIHKNKFVDRLKDNRKTLAKSLSKRFGCSVCIPLLSDVQLYKKVETRGFLIVTNEGINLCQSNLELDGETVTLRNCKGL